MSDVVPLLKKSIEVVTPKGNLGHAITLMDLKRHMKEFQNKFKYRCNCLEEHKKGFMFKCDWCILKDEFNEIFGEK